MMNHIQLVASEDGYHTPHAQQHRSTRSELCLARLRALPRPQSFHFSDCNRSACIGGLGEPTTGIMARPNVARCFGSTSLGSLDRDPPDVAHPCHTQKGCSEYYLGGVRICAGLGHPPRTHGPGLGLNRALAVFRIFPVLSGLGAEVAEEGYCRHLSRPYVPQFGSRGFHYCIAVAMNRPARLGAVIPLDHVCGRGNDALGCGGDGYGSRVPCLMRGCRKSLPGFQARN